MNRRYLRPFLIAGLASLASPSLAASPAATPGPDAGTAQRIEHATWTLGPLQVLSPGTRKQLREGTMTEGYTVTAPARVVGATTVTDGTFTMSFGAFSPLKDMPKQPKGFWYVRGTWRLVPSGAGPADPARRAEPLQGVVLAALPLDPTTGKGGYTLGARTPRGSARGGPKTIEGTINVDEKLAGTLFLKIE